MLSTVGGERIQPVKAQTTGAEHARISVIVPVLNEYTRLAPCLGGLTTQGEDVVEILVVDGGSHDGTQELVGLYSQRNPRVRLLDASPIPAGWNGKAWGLQVGLKSANPGSDWVLTVDADVHPRPTLARALLLQARKADLPALSVATLQEIEGIGQGLLHPSLLTTLVYRFGIPGKVIRSVSAVQANGQCFLFQRDVLGTLGGFTGVRDSICEDVTIARALVSAGYPVGFYEAGELVTAKMYTDWRDTWRNWTRSLPMHDRFSGGRTLLGWLEILLVQALPLPLLFLLVATNGRGKPSPLRVSSGRGLVGGQGESKPSFMGRIQFPVRQLMLLNGILVMMRLGVLFGTARAYQRRPWSYWLSPLCDLPVAIQLGVSALRRRHTWRGRTLVRGGLSCE
ncbi:MAG: glycosyltransferase [Chloroflexota bacterium]|nr:glycosyltransferase [Chloroflexota bacterium]